MTINISNLEDAKKIFSKEDFIMFGIGVKVYPRIIPSFFIEKNKFKIIYYTKTQDLKLINQFCDTVSYHDINPKKTLKEINTANILKNDKIIKFINRHKSDNRKIYLFVYRNNKIIQQIADKYNWTVIGNKPELIDKFEDKNYFRQTLTRIGIKTIPNETLSFEKFSKQQYNYFQKKYTDKFVVQITNYKKGAGKGTIFINSKKDFIIFRKKIANRQYNNIKIEFLNIASFVEGMPLGINGCATKFGILFSPARLMAIDIKEVQNLKYGHGMFCGNDWNLAKVNKHNKEKIKKIVEIFGKYIYRSGYRGIFGLDFIFNRKNNEVYPIECNPRFTGNFPVDSMVDIDNNIPSLDIFHILEFFKLDYKIEIDKLNQNLDYNKQLSHLTMSNIKECQVKIKNNIKAGIYKLINGKLVLIRESLKYSDIIDNNSFLLVENSSKDEEIAEAGRLLRLGRIIFSRSILKKQDELNNSIKNIVNKIYQEML